MIMRARARGLEGRKLKKALLAASCRDEVELRLLLVRLSPFVRLLLRTRLGLLRWRRCLVYFERIGDLRCAAGSSSGRRGGHRGHALLERLGRLGQLGRLRQFGSEGTRKIGTRGVL